MSRNWSTLALPWTGTLIDFLTPKEDNDVIRTAVLMILMTSPGERVMLPTFAAGVPDALFDQNDEILQLQVEQAVQDALVRWEDRIEFHGVDVVRVENKMTVIVRYTNKLDPLRKEIQELQVSPQLVLAR